MQVSDSGLIPHNVDPTRYDDIRRTVYVGNLDSQQVVPEDLLEFFKMCGPINFVRMAGDETQACRSRMCVSPLFPERAFRQNISNQPHTSVDADRPFTLNPYLGACAADAVRVC